MPQVLQLTGIPRILLQNKMENQLPAPWRSQSQAHAHRRDGFLRSIVQQLPVVSRQTWNSSAASDVFVFNVFFLPRTSNYETYDWRMKTL